MNRHLYLRAYMAGIAVPTAFLIVPLTVFCIARFALQIPVPIERTLIFPMALVPNIYGAWNILYVGALQRHNWPIGVHGALLPFLLAPLGFLLATHLGFVTPEPHGIAYFGTVHFAFSHIAMVFPIGVGAYYLVWKYIVSFLNRVLEIGQ
ncbi:MAG TPA: hypothetical protein VGR72_10255 [Candidatus Acidoferrales bacterium]|nr:hypothetical protein [Candidatus Acidoferrales bacterium]